MFYNSVIPLLRHLLRMLDRPFNSSSPPDIPQHFEIIYEPYIWPHILVMLEAK